MDPAPEDEPWMGVDLDNVYRWASQMQGGDFEGGGFRGRTNKLVDGCYSWWVGGLFAMIEDVMGITEGTASPTTPDSQDSSDSWKDDIGRFSKVCRNDWLTTCFLVELFDRGRSLRG